MAGLPNVGKKTVQELSDFLALHNLSKTRLGGWPQEEKLRQKGLLPKSCLEICDIHSFIALPKETLEIILCDCDFFPFSARLRRVLKALSIKYVGQCLADDFVSNLSRVPSIGKKTKNESISFFGK